MKQSLRFFAFIALLVGLTHSPGHTQTIVGGDYQDSCNNFSGNQIASDVLTTATAANYTSCSIETNHGDGSKKDTIGLYHYGFPILGPPSMIILGYGAYSWHTYAAPGVYPVKKVLIASGLRVDSMNMVVTVACAVIGGDLYFDANSDCAFNSPAEHRLNGTSYIQVDSAGVHVDTISASGYWRYRILATTPTTYTFTSLGSMHTFVYMPSCPSSGVITYLFTPSIIPPLNRDFGFSCSATPVYDYSLFYSRALRGASSGGASFIRLLATNSSCYSGTGTVTLQVSPKYNITSSGITPTPASVSGNTVTWTIAHMSGGVYTQLYVPLSPLSTTSNGDTTCNYAVITPTAGDGNLANNIISRCDSVRSSWDPNEKSVSPDGPVSAGSLLTYAIDFENLGNDTAFNIHVQDTLSPYLDASTFKLISATHNVSPVVYESGGRRIIKFDLPDIRLEDKTAPARNKGQVVFTMRMNSGLPAGAVVTNRAGIYFDGNPVVMTNTAYNNLPLPAGVNLINQRTGIQVYPNPAADAITIRVQQDGWKEATLMNAMGQIVARQTLATGENALEVQNLPAGIYYLQAKGSAGTFTQKVEKQ